jgi:restriction system protein
LRAVAVPGVQSFLLPLLRAFADGAEHRQPDLIPALAAALSLSESEQAEALPGGRNRLANRVGWGCTYLHKAGLITRQRGVFQITDEGRRVLQQAPAQIDVAFLKRYPSFVEFSQRSAGGESPNRTVIETDHGDDPDDVMERLWRGRQQLVGGELLERIAAASPAFFEQLVVQLLVAMGYGGSYAEAARVVGRSGDEGIDGIIKEDRLGLDVIYVQAKRWQGVVGRPEIQKFAGSLIGAGAGKGVFMTTSTFTKEAREYVQHIEKRIVLIDGAQLADLMIEHGVAVTPERTYVIPRVDADFFDQG